MYLFNSINNKNKIVARTAAKRVLSPVQLEHEKKSTELADKNVSTLAGSFLPKETFTREPYAVHVPGHGLVIMTPDMDGDGKMDEDELGRPVHATWRRNLEQLVTEGGMSKIDLPRSSWQHLVGNSSLGSYLSAGQQTIPAFLQDATAQKLALQRLPEIRRPLSQDERDNVLRTIRTRSTSYDSGAPSVDTSILPYRDVLLSQDNALDILENNFTTDQKLLLPPSAMPDWKKRNGRSPWRKAQLIDKTGKETHTSVSDYFDIGGGQTDRNATFSLVLGPSLTGAKFYHKTEAIVDDIRGARAQAQVSIGKPRQFKEVPCPTCQGDGRERFNRRNSITTCLDCDSEAPAYNLDLDNDGNLTMTPVASNCGHDAHGSTSTTGLNICKTCDGNRNIIKYSAATGPDRMRTADDMKYTISNERFEQGAPIVAESFPTDEHSTKLAFSGRADEKCGTCNGSLSYKDADGSPCNCRHADISQPFNIDNPVAPTGFKFIKNGKLHIHPDLFKAIERSAYSKIGNPDGAVTEYGRFTELGGRGNVTELPEVPSGAKVVGRAKFVPLIDKDTLSEWSSMQNAFEKENPLTASSQMLAHITDWMLDGSETDGVPRIVALPRMTGRSASESVKSAGDSSNPFASSVPGVFRGIPGAAAAGISSSTPGMHGVHPSVAPHVVKIEKRKNDLFGNLSSDKWGRELNNRLGMLYDTAGSLANNEGSLGDLSNAIGHVKEHVYARPSGFGKDYWESMSGPIEAIRETGIYNV